ncbi:hypothetical protein [Salmonella enterica]|nr:hypothetical protein [Salmonella enterica]
MPIQEKTTVFVFNACHADKAAAASANALHSPERSPHNFPKA